MKSGDGWQSMVEAFQSAAIDGEGWHGALQGLADATGSRCGQLLGLSTGADGSELHADFNIVTNFDVSQTERFEAAGGYDPAFNPRVRAGLAAGLLHVLAEADFLGPDGHETHPHYREFAEPCDIPFSCLTNLEREEGRLIGLAVLRSKREGPIADRQRAVFTAAAPFVRAAVRTQIALEGQGRALLRGVLDALSIAAFVCDGSGCVQVLTPAAERLLNGAAGLQLRNGRLQLPRAEDTARLGAAMLAAMQVAGPKRRTFQTVVVRGSGGLRPLLLDVIALPAGEYDFSFAPRVLVTGGGPEKAERRSVAALRAAYGLTEAEADIAVRLTGGEATGAIAAARGVAVGTVRAQVKTLMAKLGVRRQAELVAHLGLLRG